MTMMRRRSTVLTMRTLYVMTRMVWWWSASKLSRFLYFLRDALEIQVTRFAPTDHLYTIGAVLTNGDAQIVELSLAL